MCLLIAVQAVATLTSQLRSLETSVGDLTRAKAESEEKLSALSREKVTASSESARTVDSLRSELEQVRVRVGCAHAHGRAYALAVRSCIVYSCVFLCIAVYRCVSLCMLCMLR